MCKIQSAYLRKLVAAVAAIGGIASGCADVSDDVFPTAHLMTVATAALTSGDLQFASGTYGPLCAARSGSWSLLIASGATLDHPALSVVRGNAGCVLTLTSLTTDKEYLAAPPIPMTGSWTATSSAFAFAPSPLDFYGNAYLSAVTFNADFVVNIQVSNDSNPGTAINNANYRIVTATATASDVPAPDYVMDAAPLLVLTDFDEIVKTATGTIDLADGSVTGQGYVVLTTLAPAPTYADIDDAYTAGTPTAISGADPQIPAAAFTLVGIDLTTPKVRYVIIANTENDIPSYQIYTITFNGP